jgi:hypothetical protein
MRRLAIDFEHSSRKWWESGGRELWEAIAEDFDQSSVVVDDHVAASWIAAAAAIAGWGDGPDYAPHPIRMSEIAADALPE